MVCHLLSNNLAGTRASTLPDGDTNDSVTESECIENNNICPLCRCDKISPPKI